MQLTNNSEFYYIFSANGSTRTVTSKTISSWTITYDADSTNSGNTYPSEQVTYKTTTVKGALDDLDDSIENIGTMFVRTRTNIPDTVIAASSYKEMATVRAELSGYTPLFASVYLNGSGDRCCINYGESDNDGRRGIVYGDGWVELQNKWYLATYSTSQVTTRGYLEVLWVKKASS